MPGMNTIYICRINKSKSMYTQHENRNIHANQAYKQISKANYLQIFLYQCQLLKKKAMSQFHERQKQAHKVRYTIHIYVQRDGYMHMYILCICTVLKCFFFDFKCLMNYRDQHIIGNKKMCICAPKCRLWNGYREIQKNNFLTC